MPEEIQEVNDAIHAILFQAEIRNNVYLNDQDIEEIRALLNKVKDIFEGE